MRDKFCILAPYSQMRQRNNNIFIILIVSNYSLFRLGGKILIKSNGFDFAHFTPALFKRKYGIFNDDMVVFGEFHSKANP